MKLKNILKKLILVFLSLLFLLNIGYSSLTDGNVAYWAMENTSDSSGNGRTLDIGAESPISQNGILDLGMKTQNITQYLFNNCGTNCFNNNEGSISVWAKYDSGGSYNNNFFLFSTSTNDWSTSTSKEGGGRACFFIDTDNNKLTLAVYHGTDLSINYNSLNVYNWHMYTILWNSNGRKIYIDGNLMGSDSINKLNDGGTSYDFFIFQHPYNIYHSYDTGKGFIDEFSIYNRVLSNIEISELYNSGNGYNPYKNISPPKITINNVNYDNTSYRFETSFELNISLENTNNDYDIYYSIDGGSYQQYNNSIMYFLNPKRGFYISDLYSSANIDNIYELYNNKYFLELYSRDKFCELFGFNQYITPNYNHTKINYYLTNIINYTTYKLFESSNIYQRLIQNLTCYDYDKSVNRVTLQDLSEGEHNISFYVSNNETNTTSQNYSILIDYTLPIINFDMNSQYYLNQNISLIAYINDLNPYNCSYKINSENYTSCNNATYLNVSREFESDTTNTLYIKAEDEVGNINITSFTFQYTPFRINITFKNMLDGSLLDNINFIDIDFNESYNTGSNSSLILFYNPGTYNFNASKNHYMNKTGTYTIKDNESDYITNMNIFMNPIFNMTIKDEKTLKDFNFSNVDAITLNIYCDGGNDSVIQIPITSTNHQVNITCEYTKFIYLVEGEENYYRTIKLDKNKLDFDVYLLNPHDSFLLKSIYIRDYLNVYDNPALTLYRIIDDDLVQITGDFVDVEGKITAYLLNNQQYILKLTSDNEPERNLGILDVNLLNSEINIQLLDLSDINYEERDDVNDVMIYIFKEVNNNETYLYAQYNDTILSTTEVHFRVYKNNKYGDLIYESSSTSSNILFSMVQSFEYYNLTKAYVEIEYTNNQGTFTYYKVIKSDDSIDLGINFDFLNLNWVILLILSIIALLLTVSTSNIGSIILLSIGGILSMFGWFNLSISLISLAILLPIISYLRGGDRQ